MTLVSGAAIEPRAGRVGADPDQVDACLLGQLVDLDDLCVRAEHAFAGTAGPSCRCTSSSAR
jgi:hypothetical protein